MQSGQPKGCPISFSYTAMMTARGSGWPFSMIRIAAIIAQV